MQTQYAMVDAMTGQHLWHLMGNFFTPDCTIATTSCTPRAARGCKASRIYPQPCGMPAMCCLTVAHSVSTSLLMQRVTHDVVSRP